MRLLKRYTKSLLLLALSERSVTKCSFVLRRFVRTTRLLGFVSSAIISRLFKNALGGGAATRFSPARLILSACRL
ncbi:hypothetical protein [uncultured Helicobacter sp.]|uniref:hypothetical protein n=1 Tax=uncultured Helicobacter sp. TaxID=175537 RepID=UPI003750F780